MKNVATLLTIVCVLATLSGCASEEQVRRAKETDDAIIMALADSLKNAEFTCQNKPICDKAFSLAKAYIQQNSDMKMQYSDETTATTYGPYNYDDVGIQATRTPGTGDTAVIKIAITCKGFRLGGQYPNHSCASKMRRIYSNFKLFIEQRL